MADQILPRIITHHGSLVLHAAGISLGSEALILVGLSGSGKSTLATSLHYSGLDLLGDDAIVVSEDDRQARAQAVYRSLRLFPDSAEELLDSSVELGLVASYSSKRNVRRLGGVDSAEPLPLRAAFVLDVETGEGPRARAMTPADACMAFVEHSFWLDPTDVDRARIRMAQASDVAASVPTYRLSYDRNYASLAAVREAILGVLD